MENKGESMYNFAFGGKRKSESFFKIYLPQQESHKMLIPPQFIKHFNESIPEKLDLKNVCGAIWPVELEITDNSRVFITHGWEQYVKDHSLVRGEFLVFSKTLQHSVLYVQVFGTDGCLKEEPFNDMVAANQFRRTHERSTAVTGANGRDAAGVVYLKFYKTYRKYFRNFLGIPKHILVACKYKLPQDIILRNNKGVVLETHLCETNDRVVVGYGGLGKFWRKCKVKNGDKLQFIAILGDERTIKVIEVSKTK